MATHVDFDSKPLRPGVGGWTVDELDLPEVEALWAGGRYELVDGVITEMAPAYFDGGNAVSKLLSVVVRHLEERHIEVEGAVECDLVLSEDRLAVADLIFISAAELEQSRKIAVAHGKMNPARQRIYFPPTLVVESVSYGHEARDRRLKRRWYAEFGVPSYWILDVLSRSFECLELQGGQYVQQVIGQNNDVISVREFGGLKLDLAKIWPRY